MNDITARKLALKSHGSHPHLYSSKRHHPNDQVLQICLENPIMKDINLTKLHELELNEWKAYEDDILSRTVTFAHFYGQGLFPVEDQHKATACGVREDNAAPVKGISEAIDFFEYSADAILPCQSLKKYGDDKSQAGDTAKMICGADAINQDDCVIYSLGSDNKFDFEEFMLKALDKCKIFTFDCTSSPPAKPMARLNFDKICLEESTRSHIIRLSTS